MCFPALMRQVQAATPDPPACAPHDGAYAQAAVDPEAHLRTPEAPLRAGTADPMIADPAAGDASTAPGVLPSRRAVLRGLLGGAAAVPAVGLLTPATAAAGEPADRRPRPDFFMPSRVFDLTHVLTPDFPVADPGVGVLEVEQAQFSEVNGYNTNRVSANEHLGTHLDPPAHFSPGESFADELPAERFVLPLAVIRIDDRAATDPDAELTVDDIIAHEREYGRIPDGAFIAMYSGWAERVNDTQAYLNPDPDGEFHFPGYCVEATNFLIHERRAIGMGVDSPSLDRGQGEGPLTHRAWLHDNRYAIENMALPADIPDRGTTLVVGGPKHVGAYGGQVRLLALLP